MTMLVLPPLPDLLPHDHPMILLDAVDDFRELGITTSVTIRAESPFAGPNGVPSWVGIEYMGQAIAAYAGACARRDAEPVRIGFLVSTRRYEPGCTHFPVGARLCVSADAVTTNTTGLRVFECTIEGDGIHVTANLNVFMPDDVGRFLRGDSS